jgi:hypothetical protein
MVKAKTKRTTKKSRDPLPEHFNSLEEAAEFWDTHDTTDYDEYFVDVDFDVELKPRTHLIAIDGALYEQLRVIARKRRVPAEKLVSRWIAEKLKSAA